MYILNLLIHFKQKKKGEKMTYQQKSYNESPIKRKFLDFRFQFIKEYYDIINKLTNHPYQKYNELFYSFFFLLFFTSAKKN